MGGAASPSQPGVSWGNALGRLGGQGGWAPTSEAGHPHACMPPTHSFSRAPRSHTHPWSQAPPCCSGSSWDLPHYRPLGPAEPQTWAVDTVWPGGRLRPHAEAFAQDSTGRSSPRGTRLVQGHTAADTGHGCTRAWTHTKTQDTGPHTRLQTRDTGAHVRGLSHKDTGHGCTHMVQTQDTCPHTVSRAHRNLSMHTFTLTLTWPQARATHEHTRLYDTAMHSHPCTLPHMRAQTQTHIHTVPGGGWGRGQARPGRAARVSRRGGRLDFNGKLFKEKTVRSPDPHGRLRFAEGPDPTTPLTAAPALASASRPRGSLLEGPNGARGLRRPAQGGSGPVPQVAPSKHWLRSLACRGDLPCSKPHGEP